ncbi:MAG: MarR family transcriptional regulator [Acetobacteraceae bacterium]|jgi:predicted ArsR family transcriptional regulator
MQTTGDAILFQLKSLGEAQAETLAGRLRISVQAVRQRLERLLAEQLVQFNDRPGGRGRPRRIWSLTPQAASLFPDTHAQLTVDLIGSIRAELGDAAFTRLLDRRAQDITASYRKKLERAPDVAGKLRALADLRAAEGYMARVEAQSDGTYLLVEDHCPICAAATICQGFCSVELRVFQNLLGPGWQIDRRDHLMAGARRCTYQIARVSDNAMRPI